MQMLTIGHNPRSLIEGMGAKSKDVSKSLHAVAKDLHLKDCVHHRYSIIKRWTYVNEFFVIERCRRCNDYKRTSMTINKESMAAAPELTTIRYKRNEPVPVPLIKATPCEHLSHRDNSVGRVCNECGMLLLENHSLNAENPTPDNAA